MKIRSRSLLIGGVALLAGIGLGNLAGRRSTSGVDAMQASGPERSRRPNASAGSQFAAAEEPHDFKALLKWKLRNQQGFYDVSAQLERMDKQEIRDLMLALLANESEILTAASGGRELKDALQAAARELFRREGEEVLRWADTVESGKAREELLGATIMGAVSESPRIAKPWIDRYMVEYGKWMMIYFKDSAGRGATARGAEDLVGLEEILGKELSPSVPVGPLPEGFDFPLMMEKFSAGEPESRQAMQFWAARDPQAAWAEIGKISARDANQGAMLAGAFFAGSAVGGKEIEAIREILPKLDELPGDVRCRALGGLFADDFNSRAAITEIMREIPREEDRIAVADGLVDPGGSESIALSALRATGDEEVQKRVIQISVDHWSWNFKSPPDAQTTRIQNYYSGLMDQLGFSEASRREVDSQFESE